MTADKTIYKTITVSACEGGWLVEEGRRRKSDVGFVATVYVRWEHVVNRLKDELTSGEY